MSLNVMVSNWDLVKPNTHVAVSETTQYMSQFNGADLGIDVEIGLNQ